MTCSACILVYVIPFFQFNTICTLPAQRHLTPVSVVPRTRLTALLQPPTRYPAPFCRHRLIDNPKHPMSTLAPCSSAQQRRKPAIFPLLDLKARERLHLHPLRALDVRVRVRVGAAAATDQCSVGRSSDPLSIGGRRSVTVGLSQRRERLTSPRCG